ncbi:MAG TPA: alpha/beta hydrolase [Candidatus Didemnitutus sp.]|nr:alpha/beta hydrolase [Candidatus Didemnitutus sp.]
MKRVTFALFLLTLAARADEAPTLALWPGTAPGETKTLPPEADTTKATDDLIAGRPVIRIGNVSHPTITVYRPAPEKNTGAAVLVCPGGGYWILAMDLEGTEVCEWLNSIGVTGVLLKYRVPHREGRPDYAAPLQDAQRAMGMVRAHAKEWAIDPARIGVLGFSAGGNLSAVLCSQFQQRTYPAVDAADQLSCRPDFCVLIYPAYLTDGDKNDALNPLLHPNAKDTPPTFIVMTEVDGMRVENALFYYLALKKAGVPAEMHLYARGPHGYGLRRTELGVTSWPDRATDWMRESGWLKRAP